MNCLSAASLRNAGESVRQLVNRVIAMPDKALSTAEFVVADWKVRLRSTSPKITEIYTSRLRSRKPVATTNSKCLTLNLFDTSVLGWSSPDSYSEWRGPPGHFESILSELGFRGAYHKAIEGEEGADPCTIFDPTRQMGIQLVGNINDLPPWDIGAPCRIPINLSAVSRGWCLVHAATLSVAGEGVLIVGPGGAGKSGTTLAGISTGLKSAGDDYVLVCPTRPPTAFRAYNIFKQDKNRLERIDGLAGATARLNTNWNNKLEFDPEELFPGCLVERLRLHAILAPKIAYEPRTRLVKVDPRCVFQQLAPSLWTQLPGTPVSSFRFATWLTRSLPTYSVFLSDEPAEIGDTVGRFIVELTT
jgi:hypothetical protein